MLINKLIIDDKEFDFNKNEKIILVKESDETAGDFCRSIKDLFFIKNVYFDCVSVKNCDVYCECEKLGLKLFITVKTNYKNLCEKENLAGISGDFKVKCRYELTDASDEKQQRRKDLVKLDFQEFIMPKDSTEELAFYRYTEDFDYTNTVSSSFLFSFYQDEAYAVINEFIDNFKKIYISDYVFEFDKEQNMFVMRKNNICDGLGSVSEENCSEPDERQSKILSLWDYIVANKLNGRIDERIHGDGNTPLFLENAFENMNADDMKTLIAEFKKLGRQIFIIEKTDNALLESLCDRKIVF